jgi:hypothetical protein
LQKPWNPTCSGKIEHSFSKCGTYIILGWSGSADAPEIVPIPSHLIQAYTNKPDVQDVQPFGESMKALHTQRPAAALALQKGQTLQGSLTDISEGKVKNHISVAADSTGASLRHWANGVEESLELTGFPRRAGIGEVRAAIKWPDHGEQTVKIVLSQAPKAWHSFSDPVDRRLNAVLERDQRTLTSSCQRPKMLRSVPIRLLCGEDEARSHSLGTPPTDAEGERSQPGNIVASAFPASIQKIESIAKPIFSAQLNRPEFDGGAQRTIEESFYPAAKRRRVAINGKPCQV